MTSVAERIAALNAKAKTESSTSPPVQRQGVKWQKPAAVETVVVPDNKPGLPFKGVISPQGTKPIPSWLNRDGTTSPTPPSSGPSVPSNAKLWSPSTSPRNSPSPLGTKIEPKITVSSIQQTKPTGPSTAPTVVIESKPIVKPAEPAPEAKAPVQDATPAETKSAEKEIPSEPEPAANVETVESKRSDESKDSSETDGAKETQNNVSKQQQVEELKPEPVIAPKDVEETKPDKRGSFVILDEPPAYEPNESVTPAPAPTVSPPPVPPSRKQSVPDEEVATAIEGTPKEPAVEVAPQTSESKVEESFSKENNDVSSDLNNNELKEESVLVADIPPPPPQPDEADSEEPSKPKVPLESRRSVRFGPGPEVKVEEFSYDDLVMDEPATPTPSEREVSTDDTKPRRRSSLSQKVISILKRSSRSSNRLKEDEEEEPSRRMNGVSWG